MRYAKLSDIAAFFIPDKKKLAAFKTKLQTRIRVQQVLHQLAADTACQTRILNFFHTNNYQNVVFDGISKATRALVPFLREHGIEVAYLIAKDEGSALGCKVYMRGLRNIPVADVLICTVNIEKVIKSAEAFISFPVYSVFDLFKDPVPVKPSRKNYMYFRELDPSAYPLELCSWYKRLTGKTLDLQHPQTFSQKIQWIKIYDSTPLKTRLTDKYLAREYIKAKIGEKYLIPLLGVYDRPEEIDYKALPQQFVIKCNHGCAMNIIVDRDTSTNIIGKQKSPLNYEKINRTLKKWLSRNYAFNGFELQYKNIIPKIIIEKKLENKPYDELFDYKIWCFDGRPEYIQFITDRFHGGKRMTFYNTRWENLKFTTHRASFLLKKEVQKPDNLEEMLKVAQVLSSGFKYVRVDLYRLNDGSIYFGEMTFTPANGLILKFTDKTAGKRIDSLLKL